MSRGEINVDPIEGEFFSTEILGSLSDAVIREAIQNSLDAGTPGQQVKIVITFPSQDQKLDTDATARYLHGLREHLDANGSGLTNGIDYERPMDFLLIEDFGTRGLAGTFGTTATKTMRRRRMISITSGATSAVPLKAQQHGGMGPGEDGLSSRIPN